MKDLLNDHKDVVSLLAQGFKESRKHIKVIKLKNLKSGFPNSIFAFFLKDEDLIRRYLDKNLTSRLGIRMLASHQIALTDTKVFLFRTPSNC